MASKVTGRTNVGGDYSRVASLQIQVSNAGEKEREREETWPEIGMTHPWEPVAAPLHAYNDALH